MQLWRAGCRKQLGNRSLELQIYQEMDIKMGLWARITRIFRANTGAALDRMENPELVLQQTIRDMRDRVPELINSVAQVMATERLLLKQKKICRVRWSIGFENQASVKWGATTSPPLHRSASAGADCLERTTVQVTTRNRSKQALKARDNYVLNMKKRTAEACSLSARRNKPNCRNSSRRRWKL